MDNFLSVEFGVGALGLAGVIFSSIMLYRGQRLKSATERENVSVVQMEAIFSGYNQIVVSLQAEVERLKIVIEDLRVEQLACEERNDMLKQEVIDLQERIMYLENRDERR